MYKILYFYEIEDNTKEEQRLLSELSKYRIKNSNDNLSEVVKFNSRREAKTKLSSLIKEKPLIIEDTNCIIL